jgi:hypothetical protein
MCAPGGQAGAESCEAPAPKMTSNVGRSISDDGVALEKQLFSEHRIRWIATPQIQSVAAYRVKGFSEPDVVSVKGAHRPLWPD